MEPPWGDLSSSPSAACMATLAVVTWMGSFWLGVSGPQARAPAGAVMRQRVTCVSVGPPLADRRLPVEMTDC
jgi:hypothetical protein